MIRTAAAIAAALALGSTAHADLVVGVAHSTDVIARDAQVEAVGSIEISAARGETESVQVILRSDADIKAVGLSVSGLDQASLRRVVDVAGVPDALVPVKEVDIAAGRSEIIWLTVRVPRSAQPGRTSGELTIQAEGRTVRVPVSLTV